MKREEKKVAPKDTPKGTNTRRYGALYLAIAMCCIGEAAATTCNYDENHEGRENEQNSGPQRTDYTSHSLRMEIVTSVAAATLLTIMTDRTVRRLIRPTDEPNTRNDGTERRTSILRHTSEHETRIPDSNDKAACELALYGMINQPVFRRLLIPRCTYPDMLTGNIQMKQSPWVTKYNIFLQDNEQMPWTVDIYQPIFILGTWYKWQWQNLDCPHHDTYTEDDYVYGVDDQYKPSCDFRKLQNGFWRACGGMKGWRDQPDLVNYAYTHMALTLQSMIAAQQPPQRHIWPERRQGRCCCLSSENKQPSDIH
jgi:hypothetical protein